MPGIATISPNPAAFGSVRVNSQSQPILVGVKNTGNSELLINASTLVGPYTVQNVTLPLRASVGPGASFLFKFIFSPNAVGPLNGSLTINHNGLNPPAIIDLTGTGIIGSTLEQERKFEWIGPTLQQFNIINFFSSPGEMPDTFIFVKQIVIKADPKADIFKRVARVVDITTLPKGRNNGLLGDPRLNGEYLASLVQLNYNDLVTAVAAQDVIKNQVSQLIRDWVLAKTKFLATPVPDIRIVPDSDQTTLKQLIDAYTLAKTNSKKLADQVDTVQALIDKQNALITDLTNQQNALKPFSDGAPIRTSELQTIVSNLTALYTAANIYLPLGITAGVAAPANGAFASSIQAANGALTQAAVYQTNHVNFAADILAYYNSVVGALDTAKLFLATLSIVDAKKNLADALVIESAALNAVLAVCPDFDATSICVC